MLFFLPLLRGLLFDALKSGKWAALRLSSATKYLIMKQNVWSYIGALLWCLGTYGVLAQEPVYDSGGMLIPEQASYDVSFYGLSVQVFPDAQRISGTLEMRAAVVQPMAVLVLDLDTLLQVQGVEELLPGGKSRSMTFVHQQGRIRVSLGYTRQHGSSLQVRIRYEGKPRVAPRAPWDGGFDWKKTPSGAHWIATSCQTQGADTWWPVKDHVSDEPDSMFIHVRVPEPLVAASNGRLQQVLSHPDGTRTFQWYVSTPINTYDVALNIAPYRTIEGTWKSVAGDVFPIVFYVLPEDYDKGLVLFEEIKDHIRFYEKYLGPYPFRKDKYGVAQTPHLGMEHQSIIAYGANFKNGSMTGGRDWGFDALHHHEFGHEWWGNLVTNFDWRDMWIHEGFCSYMQALYLEEREGMDGYHRYIDNMRRFANTLPLAPREATTAVQAYKAPIYNKGAWILHTLRGLIGDEAFFKALRRMAYPDPAMEKVTDGSQCRFVTTDDFLSICEAVTGKDLDWFFEVYLRQPALPRLVTRIAEGELSIRWEVPNNLPFDMPVEVEIDGKRKKIQVPSEGVRLNIKQGDKPVVDPDRWLLFEIPR